MSPIRRIQKELSHRTYYVTITVLDWVEVFEIPEYCHILIDSFKHCINNKGLILYEYVIMPNHLHFIARTSKEDFGLDDVIHAFKGYTTRKIINLLKENKNKKALDLLQNAKGRKRENKIQLWQRGNYPELVETAWFLEQKTQYIWFNPVRKGFVKEPEDWLYGSAKQKLLGLKDGDEGVVLYCSEVEA